MNRYGKVANLEEARDITASRINEERESMNMNNRLFSEKTRMQGSNLFDHMSKYNATRRDGV